MTRSKHSKLLLTFTIILGVGTLYIMLMSPSPLLLIIGRHFSITDDVTLNMVVNIFFLFTVLGCIVGGKIQGRTGLRRLYSLALWCGIAGSVILAISGISYWLVLLGRAFTGLGYGFAVPFIGAAIMRWYDPLAREQMDTVNGLFPFIGTLICFFLAIPLSSLFGGSWELSLAFWGIPEAAALALWAKGIDFDALQSYDEGGSDEAPEKGIYRGLLKRREIKLLLLACACDYGSYTYLGTVLPMLLVEAGGFSESAASSIAAVAFPGMGVIGILAAGVALAKIGLRKPLLLLGQYGEIVGLVVAAIGVNTSMVLFIVGVAIFAFSNAVWTPTLFVVPMDLDDMTPARAGAAFSLIGIVGEGFSFFAPSVGGLLTGFFLTFVGVADPTLAHATALSWSLAVFGVSNFLGAISMTLIRETGERR